MTDDRIRLTRCGIKDAPLVIIHSFFDGGDIGTPDGCDIVEIPAEDWRQALSPWAYRDFGDGADAHIEWLEENVVPLAEGDVIIAGYSFAGMFALYSFLNSDVFDHAVSASGSLWYPGFRDYVEGKIPRAGKVYLSLGDRECRARDSDMRKVLDETQSIHDIMSGNGMDCILEMNRDGHFDDPSGRLARGIRWVVDGLR